MEPCDSRKYSVGCKLSKSLQNLASAPGSYTHRTVKAWVRAKGIARETKTHTAPGARLSRPIVKPGPQPAPRRTSGRMASRSRQKGRMPAEKKVRRSNKAPQFKQRVLALAATGMSQSKIARVTGVYRGTVAKILNEPDAKACLEQSRFQLMEMTLEAVDLWRKRIRRGDLKIANRLLVAMGVVPPAMEEIVPRGVNPYAFARLFGIELRAQPEPNNVPSETSRYQQTLAEIKALLQALPAKESVAV